MGKLMVSLEKKISGIPLSQSPINEKRLNISSDFQNSFKSLFCLKYFRHKETKWIFDNSMK